MSVMICSPPISIDGPLPVAPIHSLLALPGVLILPEDPHWQSGANLWGYPEETPELWEPSSVGTFRIKSSASTMSQPAFTSFALVQPITCSAISLGWDIDKFRNRATAVLEATQSFAIEQALSQGVVGSLNPYFLDGNESLPAGIAAVSPEAGLAYLEEAIGDTGRQGIIHLTPSVAAYLGFNQLRREDERQGLVGTAVGTPVSIGGGYKGAHQLGHTIAVGESWCFATGPINVRISEVIDQEIDQVLDRSQNDVTFRSERYVLATWDTALQAAVKVDWTP